MPQPDGTSRYCHNLTRKERTDLVEVRVCTVNVLPIVFVPGVMGSNLRTTDSKQLKVWNLDSLPELFWDKWRQNAGKRQELLHPDRTEVDPRGEVPSHTVGSVVPTSKKELKHYYQRRGWGEVGKGSYQDFLIFLEKSLNGYRSDQPAHTDVAAKINVLMEELKARKPVDQRWRAEKGPALSDPEDIANLRHWAFPVYACGYNWLDDNAKGAKRLQQRIRQVIAENNTDSASCEQVILVTHSMGGLVARACQQLDGMEAAIAGIVHGVMPVDGAPIAYRRCKLGLAEEGWGLGQVIGSTGQEVTAVFAQAPGTLELLPTQRYKLSPAPGRTHMQSWLEVRGPEREMAPKLLPEADPYAEIYRRSDRWWALVKKEWLAPKDGVPIEWADYLEFLKQAEDFHKLVTPETYHPNTYAFYGADNKRKTQSFERVVWRMKRSRKALGEGPTPDEVYGMTPQQVTMDGENPEYVRTKQTINTGRNGQTFETETTQWELQADTADGTGDGTVPAQSGRSPVDCAKVRQVFRVRGLEHEPAYKEDSPFARQIALYAISKIALEAKVPQGAAIKAKS